MAFFLLLYVVICLVWLFWAGMLTYLLLKFKYPDKIAVPHLVIFWGINLIVLVVSIIFIAKADWAAVPAFMGAA